MTKYRWRALLIEASYEDIKSPYDYEVYNTLAQPNAVSGTLDALEARYGIPVIYTSLYRPLAEEKAASWLSKHFTYWFLEKNWFGRVLQEEDLWKMNYYYNYKKKYFEPRQQCVAAQKK